MLKILSIISISILCIHAYAEDSKPKSKPLPGQSVYEKTLDDASKAFTQAKVKAVDVYKKGLKKALVDETKSGNLDGANLIAKEIKALDDEQAKLLGMDDVNPKVAVIGKWLVTRTDGHLCIWDFKDDGTVLQVGRPFSGKWSLEKDAVKIIWINDLTKWDTFNLPLSDKSTGDGWNIPKGGLTATRQK